MKSKDTRNIKSKKTGNTKRTTRSGRGIKKTKDIKATILNIVIIMVTIASGLFFAPEVFDRITTVEGIATVHFIDVGQADAILVQADGEAILIDAGDTATKAKVVDYIQNQNVEKLKYVVGTHPHSDHIGGMDSVITSFEVENIIMPQVMHNSVTFERLLSTISAKNLEITTPKVSDIFYVGDIKFTVIAPSSESYVDLNDYSVCLKMEYGNISFIFTGDAETLSEEEILQTGLNISADVLKVGHHGSSSSTHRGFLEAVSPDIAVISVGEGNSYGHPNENVMRLLEESGVVVYRTDKNGTIVIETDGQEITVKTYRER